MNFSIANKKAAFLVFVFALALALLGVNVFLTSSFDELDEDEEFGIEQIVDHSKIYDSLQIVTAHIKEQLYVDFYNQGLHHQYLEKHFSVPEMWLSHNNNSSFRHDDRVLNFYEDYIHSEDPHGADMASFGLGLYWYYKNDFPLAIKYLNSVKEIDVEYIHYYLGRSYEDFKDISQSIDYYNLVIDNKGVFRDSSLSRIIKIYVHEQRYDQLLKLLDSEYNSAFISDYLKKKIYFETYQWKEYFLIVITIFSWHVNGIGLAAAFLITVIWFWFLCQLSIFEKVNYPLALLIFILGAISSLLVFLLNDYNIASWGLEKTGRFGDDLAYSVFVTGLSEEIAKILPVVLLFVLGFAKGPYKIIFYACVSALGFAFAENLIYFDDRVGGGIVHGRALNSVIGHMIDSSIVAYGIVLAVYRYKRKWLVPLLLPLSLFLAATLHGFYNVWLYQGLNIIFIPYFLILCLVWTIIINNSLNNSSAFTYSVQFDISRVQSLLFLFLGGILIAEYISAGISKGSSQANVSLYFNFFSGSIYMVFFATNLGKIDLVKGHWKMPTLKKPDWDTTDVFADFVKLLLSPFSSNIIDPKNYVGKTISFRSSVRNQELKTLVSQVLSCQISDRIIIWKKSPKGKAVADPSWFLLKVLDSGSEWEDKSLLIKFEGELSIGLDTFVQVLKADSPEMLQKDKIYLQDLTVLGQGLAKELKEIASVSE